MEPDSIALLSQRRYRPTGVDPDDSRPAGPILTPIGSTTALALDPRAVIGLDHGSEVARQVLLATLGRVAGEIEIEIRSGTGVLADRRRCLLDPDLERSWLRRLDLVVDPLATSDRGGRR